MHVTDQHIALSVCHSYGPFTHVPWLLMYWQIGLVTRSKLWNQDKVNACILVWNMSMRKQVSELLL